MGKKDQKVTNTTQVDPTTLARQKQLWNQANTLAAKPYQPYSGPTVPGSNPDLDKSYEMARAAAGQGMDETNAAGKTFGDLANYRAQNIDPSLMDTYLADAGKDVNGMMIDGGMLGPGAQAGSASARDVTSKNFTDYDVQKYMNPFIGQVVDTTLSDIDRQRQQAITTGQAAATKAGAFGGSRHGVADAGTNEAALRTSAAASGQLRSDAYNSATGLITNDANRDLQGQMSNQNADVQTGIANANNATQASMSNQDSRLRAMLANQSTDLASQTTNAGLFADLQRFNASQKTGSSQFNASARNAAAAQNQNADLSSAGVRGNAASGLAGVGAQKQTMAGKGSDLMNRIGLQQRGITGEQNADAYARWQQQQQDPYNKLSWLNGFQGTPGQTNTSTQSTNPWAQAAGTAASVLPFLL